MINFNLSELVNTYSFVGLPFLVLALFLIIADGSLLRLFRK